MSSAVAPDTEESIKAVPVRHPGRWAGALVLLVLAAMLVNALITNPRFNWPLIGQYLFAAPVLRGLQNTLLLTLLAMVISTVGGLILAVMRLSENPILSSAAAGYIWFFRGTPVLTQLVFWFNLGTLFPTLGLGIPFGPTFISASSTVLITQFSACLLGLGLNEAAYMAEIVRGGINSVDTGQSEAAGALGMSKTQTLRRVVLPQAMRVIIPPTGNETISMLKTTSLVVVIGYYELQTSVQSIAAKTYQIAPLLIVAAIWYLVLTSLLSVGQSYLERYYGKGTTRVENSALRTRLLGLGRPKGGLG